jgi:CHAT domain-containing protein/Tfp pilus assembly protein PilF
MPCNQCVKYSLKYSPVVLVLAFVLLAAMPAGRTLSGGARAEPNRTQSDPSGPSLSLSDRTRRRELSNGETHSYYIALSAGEYLHIVVEQQGIDALVTLLAPDGRELLQRNCREFGPSPISLIADSEGRYRVEVRSLETAMTPGHYDLTIEAIRHATEEDKQRVIAEQMVAEAEQLLKEWKAESSRKAIDKFQGSLTLWRGLRDRREEGRTLRRIGDVYQPLSEYQNALLVYRQALALDLQANDRDEQIEVLNQLSSVYVFLSENQLALETCTRALKLSQDTGNRRGEAAALNNLGEVKNWSGDLQKALEFYRRSLSIWQALNDRPGQAQSYLYLGYTYSDLGQVREAIDAYNRALSLWQAANERRGQALTLSALGRLYSRIGERQTALDFFSRGRQLSKQVGDSIEEARTCSGIAYVYYDTGEPARALEYYDRALSLFRQAKYPNGEGGVLNDYAAVYFSLGEYQKALEYLQQSVSIFRSTGNRRMEIVGLRDIGRVFDARGDKAMALGTYLRALSFYHAEKGLRGEAITLNLIGDIYQGRGELPKALDYYTRALALCRQAEYLLGEGATQYNIARVQRDLGNLAEARRRMDGALGVVESLRRKVTSQDLRASYFATVRQHYELYIDILMKSQKQDPNAGFASAAFEISEKSRARSLLESLNEARADIRQGVEPALLERERNLEQAINAMAERHGQLVANKETAEAQTVAAELNQLTTEYDEVKAQIKFRSPRYAALTQPQPLGLKEIQNRLLNDNSVLLEYMLGDERSYLWAVTRAGISSYELPSRTQIEDAVQKFRKLLTAHQPVPNESFDERQARIKEAESNISEAATTLSQMILGPVAGTLGTKRLLIVPDGVLQYIPFQALPSPSKTSISTAQAPVDSTEQLPLLVDHEIVNEPSASALALVLSDTSQRQPAPNSVAIFANPVFDVDDPRVKSPGTAQAQSVESKKPQTFRDTGFGEGKIPALPASREEAEAIMAVAPWGTGMKALGFDANRAAINKPELAQYRIVHFATHGFIDYQHPELSGLVLSRVDRDGRPQEGFVRLHDIYNLKLSADLVVLSACNTGLGKDVKGEGLIGLTRGFMYAGAGGVAASLWKVDDDATAELMKNFYEGMFKRGLTPAAALRDAQLDLRKQKRWHAPYYWAAFVIQGQYDQQETTGYRRSPASLIAIAAGVGLMVLLAAILILRQRRKGIL